MNCLFMFRSPNRTRKRASRAARPTYLEPGRARRFRAALPGWAVGVAEAELLARAVEARRLGRTALREGGRETEAPVRGAGVGCAGAEDAGSRRRASVRERVHVALLPDTSRVVHRIADRHHGRAASAPGVAAWRHGVVPVAGVVA